MGSRANPDDTQKPERFASLLAAARAGDGKARGLLFEPLRRYLLLVADAELDRTLRVKVAASDLVQQTLLQAHQAFDDFAGSEEAQWRGWLRQILQNELQQALRGFQREKRDLGREVALTGGTASDADCQLPGHHDPPSARLRAKEDKARLDLAMAQLPDDCRQVVELRNELKPWAEIGKVMNRSAEAARKLWARAIEKLGEMLGDEP
ncbi:MAG TPA: sigma-70 family RNA polymerase sigma factor [Pirellulales bacterium]|jgi:RNA polymerase sigma-70 factor (ECF subfamily)|nr:sigma-70 family RNA polymerase sigma factor [Pirellulales bacterium]